MFLIDWVQENENDKEITVLIFCPNLRLCTKTLVFVLYFITFHHKDCKMASRLLRSTHSTEKRVDYTGVNVIGFL